MVKQNLGAVSILEQLERLRSEDTPPPPAWLLPIPLSHIGSQVKRRQSQSYKFKEFAKISNFLILKQTRHTFWSCLIRCANMKWIWRVLLKIQSGHDSVHRWTDGQLTDGQTDKVKPAYPPFNFVEAGGGGIIKTLSYQYRIPIIDKMAILSLLWESPYLERLFILRQALDSSDTEGFTVIWGQILNHLYDISGIFYIRGTGGEALW